MKGIPSIPASSISKAFHKQQQQQQQHEQLGQGGCPFMTQKKPKLRQLKDLRGEDGIWGFLQVN